MHDLLYQIALTLVPNVGAVHAKQLITHYGDAESIFKAPKKELEHLEGIGEIKASSIKSFEDFQLAEKEIEFIEKYRIETFFLTSEKYPKRLLACYDAPTILYYRGNADLNAQKIISIIGTRTNTEYGRQVTEQLIAGLKEQQVLVISGLAYGIDAIAHKSAVQNDIPNIGVLAHGLDAIYPPQHTGLAKQILLNGGLLSEYRKETIPDRHNFPRRNRIVAGMADAVIVVETALKGGSMITAELADNYNKNVFAFPGKTTDSKSAGCNYLIRNKKAVLIENAAHLVQAMGWSNKKAKRKEQKELFITLTAEEQLLVNMLKTKDSLHIDEIYLKSGLNSSSIASAMLNLEFQNVVASLPGKMYKLL